MKNAFAVWVRSLGVVARSYRIVVVLAALTALWVWAAYEWLGLPESSTLLLILALVWAIVQLLATVGIVAGTVSGAVEVAASGARRLPLGVLWTVYWKKLLNTLLLGIPAAVLVWLCGLIFDWTNARSVEVASFLTFHLQKSVSHVLIDEIYRVIEGLLWIVLSGFLLSFFVALFRGGWHEAGKQRWKLLAGCAFQTPFLTSLLSVAVFGGIAAELVNWHPVAPPGFWDYTQMIVRFALALILISAGVLFWSLSLARLQVPKQDPRQI
jgi:hypothetical protein